LVAGLLALGVPGVASASQGASRATPPVTLVSTIPTGDPVLAGVEVDSRRHLVYMAAGGSSEEATVYDEATGTMTRVPVSTFNDESIGVVESTGYAYVLDEEGRVFILSDTTVKRSFIVGGNAAWVTVDQKTGLVYVGVQNGVDVFKGLSLVKSVHVTGNSVRAAVDPATGFVYLPVPNTGKVWVIKATSVVAKVTVGGYPDGVSVDATIHQAYVSDGEAEGSVAVIRGDSTKIFRTMQVGSFPAGSAVVRRTHLLYVANSGDGTVSVIRNNVVVATDTVGAADSQVFADPANGAVFATDDDNSDKAVWALHGTRTLGSTPLAESSLFADFDSSNGRAFVTGNGGDLFVLQTPTAAKVTISRPVAGRHYVHGTQATARYTCTAGKNNTITACQGSVPSGSRIPHSAGRHAFVVHAHSAYGPIKTKQVRYHVAD
jgi:hypothetical protein